MKYDEFLAMQGKVKERHRPRRIESAIQQSCVNYFRIKYPNYIILSIPNGGSRNALEAANLKREGALAGASDLMIIVERAVMFIEMKRPKGRQQETQIAFQRAVERLGHTYEVCHSLQEFQLIVERFIKKNTEYDLHRI